MIQALSISGRGESAKRGIVEAMAPHYLNELPDGTLKQINAFNGTQVWTVPGRGDRPLQPVAGAERGLGAGENGRGCAFCPERYLETPPEKSRVVREAWGWRMLHGVAAEALFDTVAEFRRIPNLFEILSFEYWAANHGYEMPPEAEARQRAYLATEAGRTHIEHVVRVRLQASGHSSEELGERCLLERSRGFFSGGHDVIVARRHWVDGATRESQLASSGTLTPEEHAQFFSLTAGSARDLYAANPAVRYVSVFQNWLKPAGASFDHLHKQLVAIDEHGLQQEATLRRAGENPNIFNEAGPNYAATHGLLIAGNEHAIAFAGVGHRYPTVEICSTSERSDPWDHDEAELTGVSDLVHAIHAATGPRVPCNEEWHCRPVDVDVAMPWRIMVKWRISTLAGFEGATKIYLNTVSPSMLRDRLIEALHEVRAKGIIADGITLASEMDHRPDPLRYRC